MALPWGNTSARVGRRDALKVGGLTVSLAALVAACGDDLGGDTAPGRVGYQPPITDPPTYDVDDAVLLRTIASVENTVVEAYGNLLEAGGLEADVITLVEQLVVNHQTVADQMNDLAVAAGGEAWECTNPWMTNRLIEPLVAAIGDSDDPARDVANTIVAMENLTAATNQAMMVELTETDASTAALSAATLESRQSAAVVAILRGPEGYISPTIDGGDPPSDAEGIPLQFSITNPFGSIGQIELVVGPPDDNGVRQTFILQTPSLNSYIYNELEPTC